MQERALSRSGHREAKGKREVAEGQEGDNSAQAYVFYAYIWFW